MSCCPHEVETMSKQRIVHAQNARAAPDIQHNLILEKMLVLIDSIPVGLGTNFVLKHLLVDALDHAKQRSAEFPETVKLIEADIPW